MQNWQDAWWLAKIELKVSKSNILFALIFYLFVSTGLSTVYSAYLDNGFVLIDLFYLIMFTVGATWMRSKDFQIQRINGRLLAQPFFIMLNQLPIKNNVLVKSRFVVYMVYSVPAHLLFLIASYLSTPELREVLTPWQFIAFAVIWMAFGIYAGCIYAVSDAGDRATKTKTAIYIVVFFAGLIILLTFFNLISTYGIVHWTIIIARKWPVLSSMISIVLAVVGLNYWRRYMSKVINKLDYL